MGKLREPVNFYTHFVPACLTIPAGCALFLKCHNWTSYFSVFIYGFAAFTLFAVSAIYHGYPKTPKSIRFWQKFDHCCIYLMIAGSYTPTALLIFKGWLGWSLFATVWLIALIGCLLKIFNRLKNNIISLSIYILMGCIIVPLLKKMLDTLPVGAIFWLLLGGVFYIGGTYYYAKDKPLFGHLHSHELWHLFVFWGALSHYIYNYVYVFNA